MRHHKCFSHIVAILVAMVLAYFLSLPVTITVMADEIEENTSSIEGEIGSTAEIPFPGVEDSFVRDENGVHYLFDDGTEASDIWVICNEKTYYFDSNGNALRNSINIVNDHQYYFDVSCICRFGLVDLNDTKYFFTPGLGMNHGWVSIDGESDIYYFDEDGTMHCGYLELDDGVYYFDENGIMYTGWLTNEQTEEVQYFNEDGVLQYGWQEIDGEQYLLYFDEDVTRSGRVATNMWEEKEGHRVYLMSNGQVARNCDVEIGGMLYSFNNEGKPTAHWLSGIANNWMYLVCFLLSTVLVYFSSARNRIISVVSGVSAVGIMTVFSAIRAESVGFDIAVYVSPMFQAVLDSPDTGLLSFIREYFTSIEPLFKILVYICARFSDSIHVLFGAIALEINTLFYLGISHRNGQKTRWLAWLVYCLTIFNTTFNIMRQFMGLAILFYLFAKSERLNWKRVILFTFTASMFHYSCAIGILIYLVYLMYESDYINNHLKTALSIILILIPPLGPFLGGNLLGILCEKYPEQFGRYRTFIYGHDANNGFSCNWAAVILAVAGLIALSGVLDIIRRRIAKRDFDNERAVAGDRFALLGCGLDLMFAFFYNLLNSRFQYFTYLIRPEYFVRNRRIEEHYRYLDRSRLIRQAISTILIIMMMLIYWLITYVYNNTGTTSPYMSSFF